MILLQRVYPFHWIKVHGWLMWLSMGLLMPVAIILVRFSSGYREKGDLKTVRTLVYAHIFVQVCNTSISTFPFLSLHVHQTLNVTRFDGAILKSSCPSTFQVIAVLAVICSAVVAITKFDNAFTYTHERLGLALWILVWLAPLVGLIRPQQLIFLQ